MLVKVEGQYLNQFFLRNFAYRPIFGLLLLWPWFSPHLLLDFCFLSKQENKANEQLYVNIRSALIVTNRGEVQTLENTSDYDDDVDEQPHQERL